MLDIKHVIEMYYFCSTLTILLADNFMSVFVEMDKSRIRDRLSRRFRNKHARCDSDHASLLH